MNLYEILAIIIAHWISDFVLQTHEQATKKSSSNYWLSQHIATYTISMTILIGTLVMFKMQLREYHYIDFTLTSFIVITFIAHFITDYFTSRLNSYLWAKGDVHNFFVSVGFDQVLHYTQLFGTYYLLFL